VIAAGDGAKAALSAFDHLIRSPVRTVGKASPESVVPELVNA
jgi:hypothetical protein